jgi:hypothetical protein
MPRRGLQVGCASGVDMSLSLANASSLMPEKNMGMFDDIRCEAKLPAIGPDPGTRDFQTKDFECLLDQYIITEDGHLLQNGESVPFHGMLNFYHFDTSIDTWWEWSAKFTDGRLIKIEPIEISKQIGTYPNSSKEFYFPVTAPEPSP